MSIVEQIEESKASIQELSVLAGVSADKMYKWVQGKSQPNADDINSLENTFRIISNLDKGGIKKEVAKRKATLNKLSSQITDNKEFKEKKIVNGDTTIDESDLSLEPHKTGATMTAERILRIAERLSIAIEEDAHTKRELAKTLAYFREMAEREQTPLVVK